jgi:hypothetical protein
MSHPHAALIVDSDPKGLESLVYGFQGAAWRITACPAPETASLLVKAAGARILVVASRVGHDKVHTLVRQLRSRESYRTLPVLVLGPEELREPFKKHEDVDFLPLPAFVRDVLTATQLLVGTAVTPVQKPGEEPCFEDSITAQGTLSLVRTMSGLARSGSLHLVRKGRHGEILFHNGELTAAQVGQLQGMSAVQHMLVWSDGHLELRLRPVARRGQMNQSARGFVEELDRFQREYKHATKDLGPASTVYLVNEDRLHHSGDAVPAEVTPVVRLCDGQRTFCDVIDESPFRVLDTVRIVGRLVELAILNRRDAKAADASGEPMPLDEFWATARITNVAQEQAPPEPVAAPMPAARPTATRSVASTTQPYGENAGPFESKPRPQRQTREMATPKPLPTRASGEHSVAALPTIAVGGPEPDRASTDATPATPLGAEPGPTPPPTEPLRGPGSSPAPSVPVIQPSQARATQTSGAFELSKTGRQTQPRAVERRRSVVIDAQLVDVGPAGPTAPAPAPDPSPPVLVTGELQVPTSRKTARSASVPVRTSVQLDASLTEETRPQKPAEVPSDAPTEQPFGPRVVGDMQVAASANSSQPTSQTGRAPTFQIDPSLSTPTKATSGRRRTPTPLQQNPSGPHRPSGSFSAIESDFFEREADLYKEQKAESFADLDEGGAGTKNRRPDRKP